MKDLDLFLKQVEELGRSVKASDGVYLPNLGEEVLHEELEDSSSNVEIKAPQEDLTLEAPEVNEKARVEQLQKTIDTRTEFLHKVHSDFRTDIVQRIASITRFVGDLADGRWDAKGNPVEYFENISSLAEMARDLGRLKQAVEDLAQAREELNEVK